MAQLSELSIEMLSVSSANNKMMGVDHHHTLGHHSHSSTNMMSKSISGASLSSSQATYRTQCSSGLSSVSARFVNLSSSPNSPAADGTTMASSCGDDATASAAARTSSAAAGTGGTGGKAADSPRATAPVAGGGKTVLAGVAPSCFGKLRRRARFSGWKEPVYFELRSTALLTFADSKINGGTTGSGGGGLASLAAKIMHPRNSAQAAGVDWSWDMDIRGAERVVELPGLTRKEKDCFAFAVELPAREKRKTLVLAARSAAERKRWMLAMDQARRCVHPEVSEGSCIFWLSSSFGCVPQEEVLRTIIALSHPVVCAKYSSIIQQICLYPIVQCICTSINKKIVLLLLLLCTAVLAHHRRQNM